MRLPNPPHPPSERSFGFLFSALFAGLAIYGFLRDSHQSASFAWLVASGIVCSVALFVPKLLAPFNRAWFLLGQLLGKIVNPVVLGVIFFGILTPIAVISRMLGRDELRLKRQPVTSYWIERIPPGPSPDSFKNQY